VPCTNRNRHKFRSGRKILIDRTRGREGEAYECDNGDDAVEHGERVEDAVLPQRRLVHVAPPVDRADERRRRRCRGRRARGLHRQQCHHRRLPARRARGRGEQGGEKGVGGSEHARAGPQRLARAGGIRGTAGNATRIAPPEKGMESLAWLDSRLLRFRPRGLDSNSISKEALNTPLNQNKGNY
jgi:hypothetical protein